MQSRGKLARTSITKERTLVAHCVQSSSKEINKEVCHFLKKNWEDFIYLVDRDFTKFGSKNM